MSDTEPTPENAPGVRPRRAGSLGNVQVDGRLLVPVQRVRDHVTLSPHAVMVGTAGLGLIPRLRVILIREDRTTVRVGMGQAPETEANRQVDEVRWAELGVVELDLPLL